MATFVSSLNPYQFAFNGFLFGAGTTYTDTNSGAILYKMIVSASDTYTINLVLPGEGILAAGGLTLTFTNCSYVTTIYG